MTSYALWAREVKRLLRAKSRLISSLAQPIMILAVLGFGLNFIDLPGLHSATYLDFLAPGMVMVAVALSSTASGMSIIWDRQFSLLKEVLVAPVSRPSMVAGKALGGSTVAMLQGLAILAASAAIGVKLSPLGLPLGLAFMLLTSLFSASLGLAVASRVGDFEGYGMVMNFLVTPLILLSTAFLPLEGAPRWMRPLIYLDPLTYAVDGLKGSMIGPSSIPLAVDLAVLVALCVGMLVASAHTFNRCEA